MGTEEVNDTDEQTRKDKLHYSELHAMDMA